MSDRTITLGLDQLRKARELADRDGVSPSEVANRAIDRLYDASRSPDDAATGVVPAPPCEDAYEVALRAGLIGRLGSGDEPSGPATLERSLAHLVEEAERLAGADPSPPGAVGGEWSEAIAEKYRRQGFAL